MPSKNDDPQPGVDPAQPERDAPSGSTTPNPSQPPSSSKHHSDVIPPTDIHSVDSSPKTQNRTHIPGPAGGPYAEVLEIDSENVVAEAELEGSEKREEKKLEIELGGDIDEDEDVGRGRSGSTESSDREGTLVVEEEEVPYCILGKRQKLGLVLVVGFVGLYSPLSGTTYFPAIPTIANDLNVSTELINISVTVYMVLQGVSPTFWGSLGDVMGRRPTFIGTLTVFLAACIGLAFTKTYWLLVFLRCIQAAGSASVIALGSGVIGDVASPAERGGYFGIYSLGPTFGPALGPVLGGIFAQVWGWHAIFVFLSIAGGIGIVLIVLFLPETLRTIVGNGSYEPKTFIHKPLISYLRPILPSILPPRKEIKPSGPPPQPKSWRSIKPLAPLMMLFERDIFCGLFYNAWLYTVWYCISTSTASQFKDIYRLTEIEIGLCFLPSGVGVLIGTHFVGKILDRDFRIVEEESRKERLQRDLEEGKITEDEMRMKLEEAKSGEGGKPKQGRKDLNDLRDFPIEKARLRSVWYPLFLTVACTIGYGWTLKSRTSLAAPLVLQFIIGLCFPAIFNSFGTLIVDLYPNQSASVTAANNLVRCLLGAAGTAFVDPLISALNPGWAFTLLGLLCIALLPLFILEWTIGMKWRNQRADRLLAQKEKKEKKDQEKGVA